MDRTLSRSVLDGGEFCGAERGLEWARAKYGLRDAARGRAPVIPIMNEFVMGGFEPRVSVFAPVI